MMPQNLSARIQNTISGATHLVVDEIDRLAMPLAVVYGLRVWGKGTIGHSNHYSL